MMKSALVRTAALLLAMLVLPACRYNDEHALVVFNNSVDTVVVDVEVEDSWGHEDDVFLVPPGAVRKVEYEAVHDMDVVIFRQVDGFILFAAGFDYEDFEDDHDTIEIFIGP